MPPGPVTCVFYPDVYGKPISGTARGLVLPSYCLFVFSFVAVVFCFGFLFLLVSLSFIVVLCRM